MARSEPTIKEVAKLAGVSVGTVSNVINKKQSVDPKLRVRVENAIKKSQYRANLHAKGMILKRSFNVGMVIPSLTHPFFPKFADAIEVFVEERGSNVIICSSRHDATRERALCESLISKQIDGLIVAPCSHDNIGFFNELTTGGVSVVQLGRYFDEIRSPVVRAGNREAAAEAVSLLVTHGHRQILHLAGDPASSPDSERKRGFMDAARALGIENDVTVVSAIKGGVYDGTEALLKLLKDGVPISSVFADDDLLAMGCLKACEQAGLRVPQDLSIVSVGGFYYREMFPKQLSTFAIDFTAMGRLAVELLYNEVEERKLDGNKGGLSTVGTAASSHPEAHSASRARVETVPTLFIPGETIGRCANH